ncbi:oxygenase MpaB family protein [Mycobacterium sp. C31M]
MPMRDYPNTPAEMDAYFESWVDRLEATPQARQLIEEMKTGKVELPPSAPRVLHPVARRALRPGLRLNYLSVIGLLDPRLRAKLGVTWSADEERELQRIYRAIRFAYRVLPDRLTYFSLALRLFFQPVPIAWALWSTGIPRRR